MLTKFPKYIKDKNRFPDKETIDSFFEKYSKYKNISRKTLSSILLEYGKLFVEGVVENREGMALPEMLGIIFIGQCTTSRHIKSYENYSNNEVKKFTNLDTNGKLMKIFYAAKYSKIPYKHFKCWNFKMNKIPRRYISQEYKKNYNKYVDTTNIRIGELFMPVKEGKVSKKVEHYLKKYNELDL